MKFPKDFLLFIEKDLERAGLFYGKDKSNKITRFPGTRRGNKAYAAQTQKRIDHAAKKLSNMEGTLFFITLTTNYKNNLQGIVESWLKAKKSGVFFYNGLDVTVLMNLYNLMKPARVAVVIFI